LVRNRQPTGFISEIGNLVPACGKCNQSKGNKSWLDWMKGKSPLSPASRGVVDLAERIRRLEEFERWRPAEPIDFEKIVGKEEYSRYWELLEDIVRLLKDAQLVASDHRQRIAAVHGGVDSRAKVEAGASLTSTESADGPGT
jgi:hypothetical protein